MLILARRGYAADFHCFPGRLPIAVKILTPNVWKRCQLRLAVFQVSGQEEIRGVVGGAIDEAKFTNNFNVVVRNDHWRRRSP